MTTTDDRPLPRRIAVLFRIGLGLSSVLLVVGVVLRVLDTGAVGHGLVIAGCAVLILLPVLRLLLMVDHFGRRRNRTYLLISGLVLGLVAVAAVIGLID